MSEVLGGDQTAGSITTDESMESGNQTESTETTPGAQDGNQTDEGALESEELKKLIDSGWNDADDEGIKQPTQEKEPDQEPASPEEPEAPEAEDQEEADDTEEDADNKPGDEEDTTEEPGDEDDDQGQQEEVVTLKYLGKNVDVPKNQAVMLAQRGMNAGRLEAAYERLKPLEPLVDAVSVMAEIYGSSFDDMIKELASPDGITSTLVSQHVNEGKDEAVARELASVRLQSAKTAIEARKVKQSQEARGNLSTVQREQITAFARLRPDINEKISTGQMSLPKEVAQEWAAGSTLTEAYLSYENGRKDKQVREAKKEAKDLQSKIKKLEKDLKTVQKNHENKLKAPTSKKGAGGGGGGDSILAAINAGWKN